MVQEPCLLNDKFVSMSVTIVIETQDSENICVELNESELSMLETIANLHHCDIAQAIKIAINNKYNIDVELERSGGTLMLRDSNGELRELGLEYNREDGPGT